jgi:hypothetical protein
MFVPSRLGAAGAGCSSTRGLTTTRAAGHLVPKRLIPALNLESKTHGNGKIGKCNYTTAKDGSCPNKGWHAQSGTRVICVIQ